GHARIEGARGESRPLSFRSRPHYVRPKWRAPGPPGRRRPKRHGCSTPARADSSSYSRPRNACKAGNVPRAAQRPSSGPHRAHLRYRRSRTRRTPCSSWHASLPRELVFDQLLEREPGSVQPHFHGAFAQREGLGRLTGAEFFDVAEDQHGARALGESVDHTANHLPRFTDLGEVLDLAPDATVTRGEFSFAELELGGAISSTCGFSLAAAKTFEGRVD